MANWCENSAKSKLSCSLHNRLVTDSSCAIDMVYMYLEDFDDTFLASTHVHGLEDLAVLASTQLPYYLIVVLVPGDQYKYVVFLGG